MRSRNDVKDNKDLIALTPGKQRNCGTVLLFFAFIKDGPVTFG